jgi:hypothetical protein
MELQEAACTTASCIQAFVRAAELNQCPIMGESRFLLGDLDLSPDSVQSIIGPFIEK